MLKFPKLLGFACKHNYMLGVLGFSKFLINWATWKNCVEGQIKVVASTLLLNQLHMK